MDDIITDFLASTFGQTIHQISDNELHYHAMMVLFSHRYTKNDKFIVEQNVNFDIVRDVMYKYSKKAQDRYFSFPVECFLFASFALSNEGNTFIRQKPDNMKDPEKLQRILRDLEQLKD